MKTTLLLLFLTACLMSCGKMEKVPVTITPDTTEVNVDSTEYKKSEARYKEAQTDLKKTLEYMERQSFLVSKNNKIVSDYHNGKITLEYAEAEIAKIDAELKFIKNYFQQILDKK